MSHPFLETYNHTSRPSRLAASKSVPLVQKGSGRQESHQVAEDVGVELEGMGPWLSRPLPGACDLLNGLGVLTAIGDIERVGVVALVTGRRYQYSCY